MGDKIKAKLKALQAEIPEIADIRGPGAMVAVEFMKKMAVGCSLYQQGKSQSTGNGPDPAVVRHLLQRDPLPLPADPLGIPCSDVAPDILAKAMRA